MLSELFLHLKSSLSPEFLGCCLGACSTRQSQSRHLNYSQYYVGYLLAHLLSFPSADSSCGLPLSIHEEVPTADS